MLEVVVPIYNAADDLEACLQALAETLPAEAPVLLLDDASTDPAVATLLQQACADQSRWRWRRRQTNGGFVVTANHGMQATRGDVVLLNSDTIPAVGWYQALGRCLQSDPSIATATPWTNNGEIASIPEFCQSNPVPDSVQPIGEALKAFLENDAAEYPDMPTAVGFCMAIARSALESIGWFDAEHFGLGYGEENDFSQRAIQAGYRNVLCVDAYVAHRGNASFGARGLQPSDASMQRLLAKHPDYLKQVHAFIQADPLAAVRQRVQAHLHQHHIKLR